MLHCYSNSIRFIQTKNDRSGENKSKQSSWRTLCTAVQYIVATIYRYRNGLLIVPGTFQTIILFLSVILESFDTLKSSFHPRRFEIIRFKLSRVINDKEIDLEVNKNHLRVSSKRMKQIQWK